MNKAKVSPMLKCVLVLAAIALCSGLLLGAFNILTYVDPLQSAYDRFSEDTGATFSEMTDSDGQTIGNGKVIYYAVSDDKQIHAFLSSGKGYQGGAVQVYLYISNNVIIKVGYGDIDSSQSYIDRIKQAKLLESFEGKDVTWLSVLSSDIVSGATGSSKGVLNAVNAAVEYYKQYAAGGESNGQG